MNILILSDNPFIEKNMIRIFDNSNYNYSIMESKNININDIEFFKRYTLIISAHCKKIFPAGLVKSIRCINIHPGLNPYNRGYYPQVFSLINKYPVGATIHEMDEKLDHGPIIVQEEVEIESVDTSYSLYNKILNKEIELFERNFIDIIENTYKTRLPNTEGNLNLKKDFDILCEINLDDVDTFENHINKLKALTFGDYKNGYFIDNNGESVYITINLKK